MAAKVTYLLGAGASALALPTVPKFIKAIRDLGAQINTSTGDAILDSELKSGTSTTTVRDFKGIIFRETGKLGDTLDNFSSIDAYARFLYFTDKAKLIELKAFVNLCFSYWRLFNGLDVRYDSFFSLLLEDVKGAARLPDNINILTWNYDLQIESCLGRYLKVNNLKELDWTVRIFPSSLESETRAESQFKLIKLNGSTETYVKGASITKHEIPLAFSRLSGDEHEARTKEIFFILEKYFQSKGGRLDSVPLITYAWENHPLSKNSIDEAVKVCKETEVLVVIGYSFPLINRKVDEQLFSNMRKLDKIVIQSVPETIDGVKERAFSLLSSQNNPGMFVWKGDMLSKKENKPMMFDEKKLLTIKSTNDFFVPDEIFAT